VKKLEDGRRKTGYGRRKTGDRGWEKEERDFEVVKPWFIFFLASVIIFWKL
jgi:hypothetical protein